MREGWKEGGRKGEGKRKERKRERERERGVDGGRERINNNTSIFDDIKRQVTPISCSCSLRILV